MNTDLIRFIDSISRDKKIDKESVFADLEAAMISAVRKANEEAEDVIVRIDRVNGEIEASVDGTSVDMKTLGRIAAQTAKQVMIQRIREDERSAIFEEYSQRVGSVLTGTVTRYESGGLTVNLGRCEGFLPRSEQIPGEAHHPGERIRAMILDVREEQNQVRIVLTQTHPDYIRRLFEMEVPEVGEKIIEIRSLAREAGYRTKIAVSSIDTKVDAVGACVGVRGSRIRNIVDELGGEKIDIVRWNESSQVLISNALKPAEVKETFLCFEMGRATVMVDEDQLSLAIGKRGQNVRLAARLTGWDIDILTPAEHDKSVDEMEKALKVVDGVQDVLLDKLLAMGMISLADLAEVGPDPLVQELELERELAVKIVEVAAEESKRIAAEAEVQKAEARKAEAEKVAAEKAEAEKVAAEKAEAERAAAKAKEDTSKDLDGEDVAVGGEGGDPCAGESDTSEAGTAEPADPKVIDDETSASSSDAEGSNADGDDSADVIAAAAVVVEETASAESCETAVGEASEDESQSAEPVDSN